jgi:hypothetical protein
MKPQDDPDGSGVSIHWKDSDTADPRQMAVAGDDSGWDFPGDQAWTKICNSIHSLLGELDFKGLSWEVEFTCPDPSLIVEKDLTRDQYHERNKAE